MKPVGFSRPHVRRHARFVLAVLLFAGSSLRPARAADAAAAGFRLPPDRDTYFIENDLVYRRFLELMHGGTYRQINQDDTSGTEVDQGTWKQAGSILSLHSTHHAFRFRALIGGPLCVVLDSREKLDALSSLATAITRFLSATNDRVFTARAVDEFEVPPARVSIDPGTETFSRDDLSSLMQQASAVASAERTDTYTFTARKLGTDALLILEGAVFQAGDVPRVRREYHVPPGDPPPFFFAQVDARTFAREVGTWKGFRFLGGTD